MKYLLSMKKMIKYIKKTIIVIKSFHILIENGMQLISLFLIVIIDEYYVFRKN